MCNAIRRVAARDLTSTYIYTLIFTTPAVQFGTIITVPSAERRSALLLLRGPWPARCGCSYFLNAHGNGSHGDHGRGSGLRTCWPLHCCCPQCPGGTGGCTASSPGGWAPVGLLEQPAQWRSWRGAPIYVARVRLWGSAKFHLGGGAALWIRRVLQRRPCQAPMLAGCYSSHRWEVRLGRSFINCTGHMRICISGCTYMHIPNTPGQHGAWQCCGPMAVLKTKLKQGAGPGSPEN